MPELNDWQVEAICNIAEGLLKDEDSWISGIIKNISLATMLPEAIIHEVLVSNCIIEG